MKVAIFYRRFFETGGIEKTVYERGKMLSKLGYDITYVYTDKTSKLNTLEKLSEVGNVIRSDCCEECFDFVIYDGIYELPNLSGRKKIQVFNGNLIDGNEKYYCDQKIDQYIAVSKECAEQSGYECKIIPNTINVEEIKELMLEECDIPKKKYTFCIVGRFDENKGQHKLEKLIKEMDNKTKDYQFIFVGSNEFYPEYMNKVKEKYKNYNCLFVGKQDNPYKYMYNSNYVLIPSSCESQCLVLDEALICGTPVVCTNFKTAQEKVTKENGILVDKDFQNYDLNKILKLKKGFKYDYPSNEKLWQEVLQREPKRDYKFSIIIPNYNNATWLDKCLGSVLNQTYTNYEVIFVDDMSTDNSIEVFNKYYTKFVDKCKGVNLIELKQKRLNGGTRNVGILEAKGDYIMCLDSDDWIVNDKVLEKLNDFIDGEDIIRTGYSLSDGKNDNLFTDIPKHQNMYDIFIEPTVAVWTKVVKTDILKNTLFKEGTLMEDKVHHYRIVDKSSSFKDFQEVTHIWNRANATSVTTKRDYKWNNCIYRHIADMLDFIEETKNERYKEFVKDKVIQAKNLAQAGDYKQI